MEWDWSVTRRPGSPAAARSSTMAMMPTSRWRPEWSCRSRRRCSIPSAASSSLKIPWWSPTKASRSTVKAAAAGTGVGPHSRASRARMKALIVGGGIGGLTTALSLHAAGIECCVYESVVSLRALGVGINLQPNAVRELTELGLGDALAETAIETSTLAYYNKHGQLIWSEPRGRAAGYRWPQYSIHRGELLIILLDAVQARLGPERIYTGHHFVAFEQDAFGVTARFTRRPDGTSVTAHGDILVGADGIHSSVRAQFYPNEGKPVFSGLIHWRGALEAEPFLDGRTQVMIGHHDQRCVVYPISAKSERRGRSLVNWLTLLADPGEDAERENWDRRVAKERFFESFKHWNFPWLPLADVISATPEIFEYPMSDRD